MQVYYPGTGHETFHPELGKLVPGKPFDLDAKVARKYIDSGLLKRWEKPGKKETGKKEPEPPTGSSPDHSKYEAS